jgi:hypothetical protein
MLFLLPEPRTSPNIRGLKHKTHRWDNVEDSGHGREGDDFAGEVKKCPYGLQRTYCVPKAL